MATVCQCNGVIVGRNIEDVKACNCDCSGCKNGRGCSRMTESGKYCKRCPQK